MGNIYNGGVTINGKEAEEVIRSAINESMERIFNGRPDGDINSMSCEGNGFVQINGTRIEMRGSDIYINGQKHIPENDELMTGLRWIGNKVDEISKQLKNKENQND